MSVLELWLRYLLVWPGHPGDREIKKGDVLIVLAFGRNSWPDADTQLVRWQYQRPRRSDPLLLTRIRHREFSAGQPNHELAQAAQQVIDRFQLPALVQWEIGAAFDPRWYANRYHQIHCLWPDERTKYFSTQEVLSSAYQFCRQHGLEKPIILAHQRQVVRVALIARKLFGQPPLVVPANVSSFDPHSVQSWTRSPILWMLREIPARVYCLIRRLV